MHLSHRIIGGVVRVYGKPHLFASYCAVGARSDNYDSHSAWIKTVRSSRPSLQSSSIRFFSDNPIHRKDDLRLRIQQRIRKPEVSRKYLVYFADATPIYQVEGEILADSYPALEKEITKSEN